MDVRHIFLFDLNSFKFDSSCFFDFFFADVLPLVYLYLSCQFLTATDDCPLNIHWRSRKIQSRKVFDFFCSFIDRTAHSLTLHRNKWYEIEVNCVEEHFDNLLLNANLSAIVNQRLGLQLLSRAGLEYLSDWFQHPTFAWYMQINILSTNCGGKLEQHFLIYVFK